jgi:hypothetical protein
MSDLSNAKWAALTGYALSTAGIILSMQLGNIENLSVEVLDSAVAVSLAATFGGFIMATVGSVIWARRIATRQPLKIAVLIGIGSLFINLLASGNIHGPTAILMFLIPFSVVNAVSVLVATRW